MPEKAGGDRSGSIEAVNLSEGATVRRRSARPARNAREPG